MISLASITIQDTVNNDADRRTSRFFFFFFFLQSPHCAVKCLQRVYPHGQGEVPCKSRATYQALVTCLTWFARRCTGNCEQWLRCVYCLVSNWTASATPAGARCPCCSSSTNEQLLGPAVWRPSWERETPGLNPASPLESYWRRQHCCSSGDLPDVIGVSAGTGWPSVSTVQVK